MGWRERTAVSRKTRPNATENLALMQLRMATKASSRWERQTWPELKKLAEEVPEAGIHKMSMHP